MGRYYEERDILVAIQCACLLVFVCLSATPSIVSSWLTLSLNCFRPSF